jgi:hypothetical protein
MKEVQYFYEEINKINQIVTILIDFKANLINSEEELMGLP